jgi:hypothetical protein
MATTIREYAEERGIKGLVHFTREGNLPSILQRGLVTRDVLTAEAFGQFNDHVRADYTHAVCASIGFPNYKMFYGTRRDNPGVEWVVVGIRQEALWELPCAFCTANAALGSVASIPLAQRRTLAAFQAMYAEVPSKERVKLGIPNSFPSNPQAEVLFLNGVPREYLTGILVEKTSQRLRLGETHGGLRVVVRPPAFSYRNDWAYWKPGA